MGAEGACLAVLGEAAWVEGLVVVGPVGDQEGGLEEGLEVGLVEVLGAADVVLDLSYQRAYREAS